jgi:hypothetical protein
MGLQPVGTPQEQNHQSRGAVTAEMIAAVETQEQACHPR